MRSQYILLSLGTGLAVGCLHPHGVGRTNSGWNESFPIQSPETRNNTRLSGIYPSQVPPTNSTRVGDAADIQAAATGKKGLGVSRSGVFPAWENTDVAWTYNWGTGRGSDVPSAMEFYPMLWCSNSMSAEDWEAAVDTAISQGSTHLLGFNEPDQPGQCDISVEDAVAGWKTHMNPLQGRALLGSPAITNNPSPRGITYMQDFLEQCNGECNVDFLVTHWYGDAQNAAWNFHLQVNRTIDLAKEHGIDQVWITEFGLTGTEEEQAAFITEQVQWLNDNPDVGGYAYFGALMDDTELSVLGRAYADA